MIEPRRSWRWCALFALALSCRTPPYDFSSNPDAATPPDLASAPDFGLTPRCGDGIVQPDEPCDDGNADAEDGCQLNCQLSRCGDGVVWRGVEACDDGNTVDNDGCRNFCGLPSCGDGIVQLAEACDDGNTIATDDCLPSCILAHCGDGALHAGVETCDDGNTVDTDACRASCVPARCGDGVVRLGVEACDDGNLIDSDLCDNQCEPPVCGDGVREGNEECDLGGGNGDQPAFLISQPSGTHIATDALVRAETSAQFYSYSSASSHTGLEQVGESRIYLYVDANNGRLSFVLTHGIDFDSTGQVQPSSSVEMDITGIPSGFAIDLADDAPSEFFATSPTTAAGRWTFNRNSDGGVLGGLPFPGAWSITVTARFQAGITTWGWVRDDLQRIPLTMTQPITVQAFDQSTQCRTNCTVPRCGDGIFDGGEVCDDGNTMSGDGCAADCRSLQ